MAEANAGREVRARFERIARDWIDADADWRSRFPEDPGPPPLEFLGFPQAKADVAREWAVLDRFDRALPLMQESRDIIAGWIRELEALENRCADSWSDALRAGRGYENLLGMRFVRFDGAYWSIWETRVMDFAWFAAEKEGDVRIGDFWKNPGFPLSPAHPVVGIDPALAHEFAHWLPGRFRGLATDGATCELPSRERFERLLAAELHADAARRALCPDPNELTSLRWITWYADPEVDAGRYILPVGTGEPSSHGLYDLRGNAWEWAAGFVFLNDANRRVLYGGGTFGDVSFHGSTPPDPETIFVGRPDAIGFRVLMPAETIDAALGREEPGR